MPGPVVSIIIPCFEQLACTRACWLALQHTTPELPQIEVIFVDNGSGPETQRFLQSLAAPGVVLLRNEENLGFAKACNQGAAAAQSDLLLFLNNDTEPHPGWLQPLLDTLRQHPETAIAGSKLLYPDGRVQHAGVTVEERPAKSGHKGPMYLRLRHAHRLDQPDRAWVNEPREWQAVTGACLLVRRAIFQQVGGFDERYRNGYEDIDLCFKVRAVGGRIRYCPESVVMHRESVTPGRHEHSESNAQLLTEQWGAHIAPDERSAYAAAGREAWVELRLNLEELKGFTAEMRAHERLLAQSAVSGRGPIAWVRRALQRFLGLPALAQDAKRTRSALVRAGRCIERAQSLLTELDGQAQSLDARLNARPASSGISTQG